MSEFYSERRNAITDLSAFFGFLIGFLGSSPYAYTYLRVGFQTQEIVKGFTWFIAITFGAGIAVALVGMVAGRMIGSVWEGGHKVVRRAKGQEFALEKNSEAGEASFTKAVLETAPTIAIDEPPAENIRMAGSVSALDVIDLARRSEVPPPDATRLQEALGRTINIGAYDGERLVGVIRMLTDGFEWTVVTDFLVDPAYRRRGIGSALMRRAATRATGRLAVAQIPPGTEGFFRRLEVMPAYEGFVRGAKSRLQ